jgi:autotransporter passenger strand-loop-strand repeat protein
MAATVTSGQTHHVDSGAVESNDLVLSGGTLDVASAGAGGMVGSTTIDSGGVDNIFAASPARPRSAAARRMFLPVPRRRTP